jgi:hypothetical protein
MHVCDLFKILEAEPFVWIEKSRDMMASWCRVAFLTLNVMKVAKRTALFQTQTEKKGDPTRGICKSVSISIASNHIAVFTSGIARTEYEGTTRTRSWSLKSAALVYGDTTTGVITPRLTHGCLFAYGHHGPTVDTFERERCSLVYVLSRV